MKVGVYVPQHTSTPESAFAALKAAEENGLDGVFVFDHLRAPVIPGQPHEPGALSLNNLTLLAALAARTETLTVGTLVARVGYMSDVQLYAQLATVHEIAGGRFVAGLGIGDASSVPENEELGVPFPDRNARLQRLDALATRLKNAGVEVWLGGRSLPIREIATSLHVPVNQWGCEPADLHATDTWGGTFKDDGSDTDRMRGFSEVGAGWAVYVVPGAAKEPEQAIKKLSEAVPR